MATVQTILNRKAQHDPAVFTVDDTATVRDAVVVMAERRIGGVPVLSGGAVTGIFTERDLLRRVADADGGLHVHVPEGKVASIVSPGGALRLLAGPA